MDYYEQDAYEPDEPRTAVHNKPLLRGVKRQTLKDFIQFLKNSGSSKIEGDLTMTLTSMSFSDLEEMVETFLHEK